MDCKKVGDLIAKLRKEKKLTQAQLAAKLLISDKTVSKWERGLGCPDIGLLEKLSSLLGVNIEGIVKGQLSENTAINGNIRKVKLYYCENCGNIVISLGETDAVCCGRKLTALTPQVPNETHSLILEQVEDEWYITSAHPMTKEHYISAVLFLNGDKLQMTKLYPEQNLEIRFKRVSFGEIYYICNKHGLFKCYAK